jgi:hypothetical protein
LTSQSRDHSAFACVCAIALFGLLTTYYQRIALLLFARDCGNASDDAVVDPTPSPSPPPPLSMRIIATACIARRAVRAAGVHVRPPVRALASLGEALRSPTPLRRATSEPVWAWATPPGRSAIAVMRVTGPDVATKLLCGVERGGILAQGARQPPPRTAAVRTLVRASARGAACPPAHAGPAATPASGAHGATSAPAIPVDTAVVVWFPASGSYTGEQTRRPG